MANTPREKIAKDIKPRGIDGHPARELTDLKSVIDKKSGDKKVDKVENVYKGELKSEGKKVDIKNVYN